MTRDFKGVWIPANLWLCRELSISEKFLVLEIDSLDAGQGCFASAKYLSDFLQLSEGRVKNMLTDLKKRGIIATTNRSGRKRWLIVSPEFSKRFLSHKKVTDKVTKTLPNGSQKSDHINKEDKYSLFSYENKKLLVDSELLKKARVEYDDFCKRQIDAPARYDAGNTNALKKILQFLNNAIIEKSPALKSEQDMLRAKILEGWALVLSEKVWGQLSKFHQNKIELKQINQNLVEIIKTVKNNGNATRQEPTIGDLSSYEQLS